MRGKGINYDTGFFPAGDDSRPGFDPETARREMRVIAQDLHCTAVRISGGDPERLSAAAQCAAEAGLEIWFAPFPCELTKAEMLPFFVECAQRAERIRALGAEVVFVTGCELTLFAPGFIEGADLYARIERLAGGGPAFWSRLGEISRELGAFLAEAAVAVRAHFGGRLTYAAGPWEYPDWAPFDLVGVDAYRDAGNAEKFADELRTRLAYGKPLAVTEFGCCTYRGAAERGGTGWTILDDSTEPPCLDGDYERSEAEQVQYLRDLFEVFEAEGVDSAFWFTFVNERAVHRADDPRRDLDMASYSVVKTLPAGVRDAAAYPGFGWEPKEVFHALAEAYRGDAGR
jgi:hypothetical protein